MKLLKLVPNDFSNANRDVRELTVAHNLGYEVVVMVKEGERDDYSQYPYQFIKVSTRPLAPLVNSAGINRVMSLFSWALKARRQHADVISCHDILCLSIGWLSTLAMIHRPKLVYDSHEYEYGRNAQRSFLMRWLIRLWEGFLIRRCSFMIVVNESIADMECKLHHLKNRPVVVRNIPSLWNVDEHEVERTRDEFLQEHRLPKETLILKYHGMITSGRGAEMCIKVVENIPNAILLFLGMSDKAYKEQLVKMVADRRLERKVIFHEAVPQEELWRYAGIADVGMCLIENVCSSYYYSLPNKLFEDIQAMVPVVGSDFPEIRAIVEGYNVGRCCSPEDEHEVVEAIKEILSKDYRTQLIAAKKELCWEHESSVLEKAYSKLR